jgi:hypothetical protein
MLVVTNLVLPCVTESNSQCYDTTHQRFHFARGLLDFYRLVVTNLVRSTDDNVHLRKLSAPSKTAYLSHSCRAARQPFNGADSGAQPPRGGVFRVVTVAVPTHTCKRPQKPFPLKKRGAKSEQ